MWTLGTAGKLAVVSFRWPTLVFLILVLAGNAKLWASAKHDPIGDAFVGGSIGCGGLFATLLIVPTLERLIGSAACAA